MNSQLSFHGLAGSYKPDMTESESEITISLDLSTLILWFKCLSLSCLQKIASAHKIEGVQRAKKDVIYNALQRHACLPSCRQLCYIFKPGKQRAMSAIMGKFGSAIVDTPLLIPCSFLPPPESLGPRSFPNANAETPLQLHDPQPLSFLAHASTISDDVQNNPLEILGLDRKEIIIREWESEVSTEALKLFCCAVCAIGVTISESSLIHPNDEILTLLRNDDIPTTMQPVDYDFNLYKRAYLSTPGMESTTTLGRLRICKDCRNAIVKGRMPKFALVNWLYSGYESLPKEVMNAFQASSIFERMLIARARFNSICCRFSTRENDLLSDGEIGVRNILGNLRKGVRGNIIVSPLDTVKMNSVIPPGPSSIKDTMCTVFVGKQVPDKNTIHGYSPVLVRRSRVKLLIHFLLINNPHYKPDGSFQFSPDNLDALFAAEDEEAIPNSVYVGVIDTNDALEASISDYTDRNAATDTSHDDELLMENVGYTDGDDTPANYRAMKAGALEHCISGKPFLASGKGSTPIPDFHNPSILTWLFPHLDPWGIAGFHHPMRKIYISMEDQLSHMLKLYRSPAQQDPEFAFVFFNVMRKALVSRSMHFSVPLQMHRSLVSELLDIRPEVLEKLNKACQIDPLYKPIHDDELKAFKLLSSLGMAARHVPGSNGYKVAMRNEIRALINSLGAPVLFITLNPSDVDNPIVRLMVGEEIDLEDASRGEDMSEWQRKVLAARNPAACALFFDLIITKFIRIVLQYGRDEIGAFGRCTAYYGTVEAQGKGTLHCHMLIWLDGHLSPQHLRDRMISSPEYKTKYISWLESIIKCEFPDQDGAEGTGRLYTTRLRAKDRGIDHPGVVPAPSLSRSDGDLESFWSAYNDYLDSLLYEYNWHDHQATCWKMLKRGEKKSDANCHLGMDGSTRLETVLDPETAAVLLRRLHPFIASYNDLTTFLLKCNANFKFIGSGQAAKSFLYYLTDYITKYSLPMHVGMAALLHAIHRTNARVADINAPTEGEQVGAVTTAVNSMMGKQEISHQQVMSYLIGSGNHYTSHKFQIVHWGSICRFVESVLREDGDFAGSDCEGREELVQQTVGLLLGIQEIHASSQLLDYIHRSEGAQYEELCIYSFFAETAKTRLGPQVDIQSDRLGFFNSWDHPQRTTHELHFRRKCVVPVLLGPSIPNPNIFGGREIWAKYMLILFKPWRMPGQLRESGESWQDAYESYEPHLSSHLRQVVENMTVLSESKDARDIHARQRREDEMQLEEAILKTSDAFHGTESDDADEGEFDEDFIFPRSENVFEVLSNLVIYPQRSLALLDSHVDRWAGCNASKRLDICQGIETSDEPLMDDTACMSDRDEEVTRTQYGQMRALRKRAISSVDGPEGLAEKRRKRLDGSQSSPIAERTILRSPLFKWSISCTEDESFIVRGIVDEMNLSNNPEQLRAFRLVANQIISLSDKQLLLYISGVGGTGKSHVIKCIVLLFERLGRRKELALVAPTGIAVVLIGGQTLHSLLKMSPNGYIDVEALTNIFRYTSTIVLDEVSMVDARLLNAMSTRARLGKGEDIMLSGLPFAGLNVIFMGDLGQLKPPIEHSLYSHRIVNRPSFSESNIRGQEAMNGIWLWRQVRHVVELVHNHRQAADSQYADFLKRLRVGSCISRDSHDGDGIDDFEYLQPRLLSALSKSPTERGKFRGAPVIVGSKGLRDVLNAKLLVRHALELRKNVYVYHSTDSSHRKPVKATHRSRLWDLNSSITKDSLGRLLLFKGMKVMITENLAIKHGIVNGREAIVKDVKYTIDCRGRRTASVVYVYVENCGLNMTGMPEDQDIVPIFPTSKSIAAKVVWGATGLKSFSRKQIPLIPAYAYTDFKAQGRSLTTAVADIHSARGQGVYVMLSRVRTLEGLAILRPFARSKITARLPEELRAELSRLENLSMETRISLEDETNE